jgi:DNA-binding FadR family transcriptional regulator
MKTSEKWSDQVTNKIRQDMEQDKYKAGEKIPAEPELMKLYGVGRSTVDEAIKTLAMRGILKVQQGFEREVHGISHFAMSHHLHEQLFEAIKNRKEKLAQQVLDKIIENNY